MQCPYCVHGESKVIDKRDAEGGKTTRRRRECLKCNKRFTTYEKAELYELTVVKKDGRREHFSRDKLVSGLLKACEKRPIPREKIENIADKIEIELRKKDSIEIPSKLIGEKIIKKLKALDKVAYIRFASVYRDFTDLESFEKELRNLIKK